MNDSLFLLPIVSTVVFLLLAVFVVSFALLFQRRQIQNIQEKAALKAAYEQTILQSQIEVQNQTLQQVGQELHDNIGQLLSLARLHLNVLEDEMQEKGELERIVDANTIIEQSIHEVRLLTKSLDDGFVKDFGLVDSLTHEFQRLQRTRRYQTQMNIQGTIQSLGFQREIVIFRVVQELLNNAIKHSGAKRFEATIDYQSEQVEIAISDNGKGFDYDTVMQKGLATSGAGLRNIHRRIELLGGTCCYNTAPLQGTVVTMCLPYKTL